MKMAVYLKESWRQKRENLALQQRQTTVPSFFIPSPVEAKGAQDTIDELRAARAKHCTDGMLQYALHDLGIDSIKGSSLDLIVQLEEIGIALLV